MTHGVKKMLLPNSCRPNHGGMTTKSGTVEMSIYLPYFRKPGRDCTAILGRGHYLIPELVPSLRGIQPFLFSVSCRRKSFTSYLTAKGNGVTVSEVHIFFLLFLAGSAATTGLLYQPQMIDDGDCGAIGGMKIGRGNRRTRRKPAPVPICPQQIIYDLTRLEPGRRGVKPATNRLSYDTARSTTSWSMHLNTCL
jgi:hypothetical protein